MLKFLNIVFIILKNIFRYKRNYFVMSAIGLAAFFIVILEGYNKGMQAQLFRVMHDAYTGDFAIISKQIDVKPSPTILHVGWDKMLNEKEVIFDQKNVRFRLRRLVLMGSVMGKDESKNCYATVVGCDFTTEKHYLFKTLLKFYTPRNQNNDVVYVSDKIASKLNLKIRDTLYLFLIGKNSELIPAMFEIGGIFSAKGFPNTTDQYIFIDYEKLHNTLRLTDHKVTSILLMLDQNSDSSSTYERIKKTLPPDMAIITPDKLGGFFISLMKGYDTVMHATFLLMYLMIFLFIYSTMVMSMNDHRKEIGIMTSLGIPKLTIFLLYSGQGFLLGVFPAVIGSFFGCLIVLILSFVGIPAVNMAMQYAFAGDTLFLKVNLISFFYTLCGIPLIGLFGAIFPVLNILKLKPLEAIEKN